jgi:ATP-dependent RNA helicase DeaD
MSITDNATGSEFEPDENILSDSQDNSQVDNGPLTLEDVAGDDTRVANTSEATGSAVNADSEENVSESVTDDAVVVESEEETTAGDKAVEGEADERDSVSDNPEAKSEKAASGPSFDDLGLPKNVLNAVKKVGFETPSAIQAQTIPELMAGRDVLGLAQTGTGKTAAFALPILARIDKDVRHPQALVLAPTRELALQVADSFQSFADHLGGISVLPIYGGQAYGIQLSGLRRGAQIIVGTPGRVIDHLEKGSLDISELRFMVLDEADEMLNMGFQEDVERVLEDTPDDKQVALFSATMPNGIRRISKQYMNDPREIQVKSETRTNTNITQR